MTAENSKPPVGMPYSLVYARSDSLASDSQRMRRRLAIAFFNSVADASRYELSSYLESVLGVDTPHVFGATRNQENWKRWTERAELRDLLSAVTLTLSFLKSRRYVHIIFLEAVKRILSEEQVAFQIDTEGGVHPLIDETFTAQFVATIQSLNGDRYEAARQSVEKIDAALMTAEPDGLEACRRAFGAAEIIFKMLYPKADRLTADKVRDNLKPDLERIYANDPVEKRVMHRMAEALMAFVDAAHNYRHEQGKPEPHRPSETIYVLLVTQGLSYVRWLADIDKARLAGG